MLNSCSEWRNFQFAWDDYYWFFFLHTLPSTIAFRLDYLLFYLFYAKITTFFLKNFLVRLLSNTLALKHLMEKYGVTEIPVGYARNDIFVFAGYPWWRLRRWGLWAGLGEREPRPTPTPAAEEKIQSWTIQHAQSFRERKFWEGKSY